MNKSKWILCPVCGSKTRLQIRGDTDLKNFPLYCPKCRQETLINANNRSYVLDIISEKLISCLNMGFVFYGKDI